MTTGPDYKGKLKDAYILLAIITGMDAIAVGMRAAQKADIMIHRQTSTFDRFLLAAIALSFLAFCITSIKNYIEVNKDHHKTTKKAH